jgi:hypothetical protein
MGHYAKVLNQKVIRVIVAEPEFFNTFVDSSPGTWVQTSYNTRGGVHYAPGTNKPDGGEQIRYNYAGVGYNYDGTGFYSPQPFPSWILDKTTYLWNAPIPYPTDDKHYTWNESTQSWSETVSLSANK